MIAIDTNVWIYSHDARDPAKQQAAQEIIRRVAASGDLLLLWQVGCEFLAASRKLAPLGFTSEAAWNALAQMRLMAKAVAMPGDTYWDRARDIQERHSISLWDSLIVAGCLAQGAARLYSEDMAPGDIDGVTIVNPFTTPQIHGS